MDTSLLPILLGIATLLPLISFFVIFTTGRWLKPAVGGYLATAAIVAAGVLSAWSMTIWLVNHFPQDTHHAGAAPVEEGQAGAGDHRVTLVASRSAARSDAAADATNGHAEPHSKTARIPELSGDYPHMVLGRFGKLRLSIGYYIDSLTVVMFCMVTLIASCIHFYSMGYMHEEETTVTDHEVTLQDGTHLKRPGRYAVFFQYMSLFSFSMLGLVLAGNMLMVFVFWELVGICSYFLIGFYIERKTASNAANKAFIVNRIGDFGMLIGMMALWTGLGTLTFGDTATEKGIFSLVRPAERDHKLVAPPGMVLTSARDEIAGWVQDHPGATRAEIEQHFAGQVESLRDGGSNGEGPKYGYGLLIVAGIGIFCGCVGKSAQFPLLVWLPDAMEGPTPVSALVHSATMVAAGVYLVGRFFPVFTTEVLLVIAVMGVITLFMAATIAITATDIKRVLAYSTVSQLGYMMLALGLGGWLAGMMHLVTHAFFKSLLFLCSGSVIHAVHSNEMTDMGGLRKKMPVTAYTMLIGCLAISGLGIPFVIGLSGYYSKDRILEQAFMFSRENPSFAGGLFFTAAAGGAAITAFYMFRLWFMTFAGAPRDADRYAHAHESPKVIYVPLIILAVFAAGVAWRMPWTSLSLEGLLEQARPAGTAVTSSSEMVGMTWPDESLAHEAENYQTVVVPVTLLAFFTAIGGMGLAMAMYLFGALKPSEVARQFNPIYRFLRNKWWLDEVYDVLFVRPTLAVARLCAAFDIRWIDWLIDNTARAVARFARFWEWLADQKIVDGILDGFARWTYSLGVSLRAVQTGSLRQYVVFLVLGVIALFLIISFVWTPTFAR